MIKFERVKESFSRDSYFSLQTEEFYDCSAFRVTLFRKSFRIKYSKKFNYFLIARKIIKSEEQIGIQRVLIDKLASLVLLQALEKEGLPVSNLDCLPEAGKTPTFNFKGMWKDTPVFIKLLIYANPPSSPQKSWKSYLRTEYENGLLASSVSPYCLKPITYLELPHFELLVTPFVENARPLYDVLGTASGLPQEYVAQLHEVKNSFKKHYFAHGDLHGDNILIGSLNGGKEQLYIIDFAPARHIEGDEYFNSREYKSDERNFNSFFRIIHKNKHTLK